MKKIFALMGMAVIVAAACNKETPVVTPENGEETLSAYEFTLNASMDDEMTKTAYANDKTFSWSAGDQISVLFHKGDENKFFTLTTSEGGSAAATFTGTIEAGWEEGSSEEETFYYALFPAGEHTYTPGASKPVTFSLPEVTDYTAGHFSANLPLRAKKSSGVYTFKHMAGTYKFSFKDLDAKKVCFTVENQKTRQISGSIPCSVDNFYSDWAEVGSSQARLSYIENVASDKTATFYIPYRGWTSDFLPKITLVDEETDNVLFTATAKNPFSGNMASTVSNMVVVPAISAPGEGSAFISKYGIDWSKATMVAEGSADPDGIKKIKAHADASKLYLYLEVKISALYDDPTYTHTQKLCFFLGDGAGENASSWNQNYTVKDSENWIKKNNSIVLDEWDDLIASKNIVVNEKSGVVYFEIELNRSFNACLQGASAYVGVGINTMYIDSTGAWCGSSSTMVGYAPAKGGDMLQLTMPEYSE